MVDVKMRGFMGRVYDVPSRSVPFRVADRDAFPRPALF